MQLSSIHSISTSAKFGDKRLNLRFEKILNTLSVQVAHSIPRTFKLWSKTKSVYRFLSNKKVTQEAIITSQYSSDKAFSPFEGGIHLAIHDTTELNYTGHRSEENLGCLGFESRRGFFLHNTLLCNEEGVPQAVFYQHYWSRTPDSLSRKKERKYLSIEEKESNRWVESVERINQYFKAFPSTDVINICDREGDIYELLQMPLQPNSHYLIRSCNNRRLHGEEEKLWEQVAQGPVRTSYRIELTDRQTLKKRVAQIEIKWIQNAVLSPPFRKGHKLDQVRVNMIYIQEVNQPKGIKPIDWKLLTSLSVESITKAKRIITYYSCRWRIETFHYILKQGCKVESLQLEQEHNLKNAISLYSLIACRLLAMMYLSREKPDLSVTTVGFSDQQYFLLHNYLEKNYQFKFDKKMVNPTIENFTRLVGMLGGYLKHNSPHPGIKVLWRGMRELLTILNCFEILSENKCG